MSFNQTKYITDYNKNNYKMYQFRVRLDENEIIDYLNKLDNKSKYITRLIDNDINNKVLTIKEIRTKIKPILNKYGINNIYLFGSYARGEANNDSDVDIYCEKGNIRSLINQVSLIEELEDALSKHVDIIFTTTRVDDYFKNSIMEDMIKIC